MNKLKGFTLIELAIVLAVIGLVSGLLYPNIIRLIEQGKIKTTRDQLLPLRNDIVGYAIIEGHLPEDLNEFGNPDDAWHNSIIYRPFSSDEIACNGGTPPEPITINFDTGKVLSQNNVAFFLGSPGADYQQEWIWDSDDKIITLTEGSDDITQYITYDYLYSKICNTYDNGGSDLPDTDDYTSAGDIGWYAGNSHVITPKDKSRPDLNVKFEREGTKVAGKIGTLTANSISFEVDLELTSKGNKNGILQLKVQESVIFKEGINIKNDSEIIIYNNNYPDSIYVYFHSLEYDVDEQHFYFIDDEDNPLIITPTDGFTVDTENDIVTLTVTAESITIKPKNQ